jgi:hypothetical protein
MAEDLVLQANGPYLRVVLPDLVPDWNEVWSAIDVELEDGIQRIELVTPEYRNDQSEDGLRRLIVRLVASGVTTYLERVEPVLA